MSGSTTKTVGAVNSTTNVGITLKRTVAKIALQTTVDAAFSEKYSGTLSINSVKLSKAASQSPVIAGTPTPGAMTFSHTQTPASASDKYNSLFYIYENGRLPPAAAYCWRSKRRMTWTERPRPRTTVRR